MVGDGAQSSLVALQDKYKNIGLGFEAHVLIKQFRSLFYMCNCL